MAEFEAAWVAECKLALARSEDETTMAVLSSFTECWRDQKERMTSAATGFEVTS